MQRMAFPAREGRKNTSGQIKGEESAKWKEVWAVSFWLDPMFWRLNQEIYQQSQIFYFTEIDKKFWASYKNTKVLFSKGKI